MPTEYELLPDEPVMIVQYLAPHDPSANMDEIKAYLDYLAPAAGTNWTIIFDLTNSEPDCYRLAFELDQIANEKCSHSESPFQMALVGTPEMIKMLVYVAKQEHYGQMKLALYTSLDSALGHIRLVAA